MSTSQSLVSALPENHELGDLEVASHKEAVEKSAGVQAEGSLPDPQLGAALPGGSSSETPSASEATNVNSSIDTAGFFSLAAQHLSSTWGDRTAEFAFYLFLIELLQNTLLPASLYGFFTTGISIFLSGSVGSLVDKHGKLKFVRSCILAQKISASAVYTCFVVLFLRYRDDASRARTSQESVVWVLFSAIVVFGCVLKLSTIGMNVAIERDWVTCIADGSSSRLTKLNTWLRRIDLLCKLVAPLFVSLLTSVASYPFTVAFLGFFGLGTMVFEFIWIDVVYRRLPALKKAQAAKDLLRQQANEEAHQHSEDANADSSTWKIPTLRTFLRRSVRVLKTSFHDWRDFAKSSVFLSSVSISLLYLTVLSFDGTMLSYLKTHAFSDAFIAGMRGVCVVAGLIGTFMMPLLERYLGLVRAGSWSIWSEVVSLVPVLASFYVGAPPEGQTGPAWNVALLFGGMALSRIGLWAFDLAQLKELQISLADHPRRNTLTALQFSLQNIADLLKYILTIILNQPSQFRWAALVSYISVVMGALCYTVYVKRERGHVLHLDWVQTFLARKSR